ncbi:glyoxalase [Sphingorhabdus lutea]|uniref:Glyoxalase n=1 Tax=Sphingorhabdus lutea TaxID=1913578 RepID=A0A1L3JAN1_9SPHN|nr:VOC family protein [Sphingorhabdus lutea]APG62181.1 glyoxalase [Sphingorhabdus lutea]
MNIRPFHLAVTVDNLADARDFYGRIMGCAEGRSSDKWIDFNLYGHQFVVHLDEDKQRHMAHNPVDGHQVPVPHFGVVLTMDDWQLLAESLTSSGIKFAIEPTIRFAGQAGEQATMFFTDPAGNALEFKAFAHDDMIFAT